MVPAAIPALKMALVIFSMLNGASRPSRFRILVGISIPPFFNQVHTFGYMNIGTKPTSCSGSSENITPPVACQGKFEKKSQFQNLTCRNRFNVEPVPKLIDCALTRTVLEQALQFFRLSALQNCEFQSCFPKN
jgi:hypothetical protein